MREKLTAGEICTRETVIAFRTTSLSGAARLMRDHHVGCLVVVDEVLGKRLVVGLLTDRDIVTAALAYDLQIANTAVQDVMSTDLVSVREDDSLIDVMRTMRFKGVRRVPVVGSLGDLQGLVTLSDVLDILAQEMSILVGAIHAGGERERKLRHQVLDAV